MICKKIILPVFIATMLALLGGCGISNSASSGPQTAPGFNTTPNSNYTNISYSEVQNNYVQSGGN